MTRTVTLIEGDGIGPEVTAATVRVLEATGVAFDWERHPAGVVAMDEHDEPLPSVLVESIRRNKIALKGPVTTPVGRGFRSVNVELRKRLDLFSNLRPIQTLSALPGHFGTVDLVVVRENTEGLYSGIEHEVVDGVVESLKIITRKASTRIARFAFEHARTHGRKLVTAVHKANIMKLSDGLFLRCFREVAEDYPEIESDDRIVDNMAMQVVINPLKYDVLVLPNLYGDILSDLCAGLVGGLGVVPGANLGEEMAVFEAVHGSAPDIAGRNLANPTALIRSGVMMLEHLGHAAEAKRVRKALDHVMSDRGVRTQDVGGEASTTEFADALVAEIESSV
ncbi:MAG: isocitrate/isopropylmalate dehydrogenase family protein [Thermoanaerobaculia bacterium]